MIRLFLTYILLILCFNSCKKDVSAFVFHPGVESRVSECLSSTNRIPDAVSIDTGNFTFAVFSDIHITEDNLNFLDHIRADVEKYDIDFCIVAGDLTENGLTLEFSTSQRDLWQIGVPYYVTIGNHDLYQQDSWEKWLQYFGPSVYSIQLSNFLQIIFLDTASGLIGKKQMDWLENELKNSLKKTIVVSHYPIYNGKSPSIWRLSSAEERYKLLSMFRDSDVLAYISGHYHGFEHYSISDMHHFTVGSMYPKSLDSGTHGYLLCSFKNGNFEWEKIELE